VTNSKKILFGEEEYPGLDTRGMHIKYFSEM